MESGLSDENGIHNIQSDITRIEWENGNPLELFQKWHQEACNYVAVPNAFCLSTTSKNGKVSSRTLLLRKQEPAGFVFMTDRRSNKCQDLSDNPYAAMAFFWGYMNNDSLLVMRQVRVTGTVTELDSRDYADLYEREPLYCKIRTHVCVQGQEVEWAEQKEKHDKLVQEVKEGKKLDSIPSHVAVYRLDPDMLEFYESVGSTIADRLNFKRNGVVGDSWTVRRLSA